MYFGIHLSFIALSGRTIYFYASKWFFTSMSYASFKLPNLKIYPNSTPFWLIKTILIVLLQVLLVWTFPKEVASLWRVGRWSDIHISLMVGICISWVKWVAINTWMMQISRMHAYRARQYHARKSQQHTTLCLYLSHSLCVCISASPFLLAFVVQCACVCVCLHA